MNQTLPTADLNTAGTTDIIPSVAIDRIIAQRNEGSMLLVTFFSTGLKTA